MDYVWRGQSKGIGKWKDYEDGDLISKEEAEGDSRFERWIAAGVLESKIDLDAEAKRMEANRLKVAENRALEAQVKAEEKAEVKAKKKADKK